MELRSVMGVLILIFFKSLLNKHNIYYRYSSEPPALLRVDASVSILLLSSVFIFPKRYEQNHLSKYIVLDICILNNDFRFEQDPLYWYPCMRHSVSLLFFVLDLMT